MRQARVAESGREAGKLRSVVVAPADGEMDPELAAALRESRERFAKTRSAGTTTLRRDAGVSMDSAGCLPNGKPRMAPSRRRRWPTPELSYTVTTYVLDAGALIAVESRQPRSTVDAQRPSFQDGHLVRVPAGVIGQVWRNPNRQVLPESTGSAGPDAESM